LVAAVHQRDEGEEQLMGSRHRAPNFLSGLLAVGLILAALAGPASPAVEADPRPNLPVGFEDRLVSAVELPTAVTFTPDGEMLAASQSGRLFRSEVGRLVDTPVLDLSERLCPRLEQGLLGVAVHPRYESNRWIYVFWTHDVEGCLHRVSRFTVGPDGVADPASERILIDRIPSPNGNHNGGDLQFGRDGYLYVSIGDGGCDYAGGGCAGDNDASRDRHVLSGKILRLGGDGEIPVDNPYLGPTSGSCRGTGQTTPGKICEETFAWGLRNPFRIAFDADAEETRFFINDVGQDHWEEIDEGRKGADYGWNVREGHCANGSFTDCGPSPDGMVDPIYSYRHDNRCGAITGGAFVPAAAGWPAEYGGDYLFADYGCGTIFHLERADNGEYRKSVFVDGLGASSAVHLVFGPSPFGLSLYYTSYAGGGEIRRIDYTGAADRPPVAELSAGPLYGPTPLTVRFDAGATRAFGAPGGLRYHFGFGDGTPVVDTADAMLEHTYASDGAFTASVVAEDSKGRRSAPAKVVVYPGESPPVPRVTGPDRRYGVGEPVRLEGAATDAPNGTVPPERLTWRVLLHHEDHTHPFLGPLSGAELTFDFPRPESLGAAATSWLEVILTARDASGLTATAVFELRPRMVELSFETDPGGLRLLVDGQPQATPWTVASWPGLLVRLEAPDQAHDGERFRFRRWSDGGERSHTIQSPEEPVTWTATFRR
jgi:glucose/arabinose dehydrogenase